MRLPVQKYYLLSFHFSCLLLFFIKNLALAQDASPAPIPSPTDKVLTEGSTEGITKKAVIELAEGKYKVEARPVLESELKTADEVFITSSFKDIVPIVRIDDLMIAKGEIGPVTKDLMAQFVNLINMW